MNEFLQTTSFMVYICCIFCVFLTGMKSRSRDAVLERLALVSVSKNPGRSRSRLSVSRKFWLSRSRSRLGRKIRSLGLVSVSDRKVTFISLKYGYADQCQEQLALAAACRAPVSTTLKQTSENGAALLDCIGLHYSTDICFAINAVVFP